MIPTNLPDSVRTPGSYQEFDFSQAGTQLTPLGRRVVIVAEKSAAGTAPAEAPIQLFGEADGDAKAGTGSLAALMNREALLQAKLSGKGQPEIWLCPIAEPGAGTAATYMITVTGPATEAKNLILTIAGRLLVIGVSNGDAANTIATAIKNKCDELKASLPVTAAVVGAVVTLTFVTKGTNGNDCTRTTVQTPAGVTIAHAIGVAGAGVIDPTTAIAALYDQRYHGLALSNHSTADAAALLADAAFAWGYGQKNYRFYAMGETGALGTAQTLQASYNDYRFLFSTCPGLGSLPGEAAIAKLIAWLARDAPNANLDGEILALAPPGAADTLGADEIETALASGLCPLVPAGSYVKLVRLVTSEITFAGDPFEPLREPALPRTAAYQAEQVSIGFDQGFQQEVLYVDATGDDVTKRIRDMVIDKDRASEQLHYIQNVNGLLPQIIVQPSGSIAGRVVIAHPLDVVSPLHQGDFLNILYLG